MMLVEKTLNFFKSRFKILKRVNISFHLMLDLVMICIYLHNIWNVKFDGFDVNYALDVRKRCT